MLLQCHPSLYSNSEEISSFVILGQLILLRRRVRTTFQVTTLLTIYFVFVGFTGPEMKFQPEVVARSDCRLLLAV